MARISVDELYQKQEAGENLFILDLRSQLELEQDPLLIRGAFHMTMDEVPLRHQDIPRDRDVILYCSCPNEVSSARIALELHRKGISRVRPLLGGIDVWRERKYPMELRAIEAANAEFLFAEPGTPPANASSRNNENQPIKAPDKQSS